MKTTKRKKFLFLIITFFILTLLLLLISEIAIRIVRPQVIFYPRWKYSDEYGFLPYKNITMKMKLRGKFEYIYKINKLGYKGKLTPLKDSYIKTNIVVLGDSYSFGIGVNEGEEYPAIIGKNLKDQVNVINLGVVSWGLTQQIRRYYEFGQLYKPKIVILQFCQNDPVDNFIDKVTIIEDGQFKFQNTKNKLNKTKRYLSKSPIQKSHLYNFVRNFIYGKFREKVIKINVQELNQGKELFYNELLQLFSEDLKTKNITLLFISVNNELNKFPGIKQKVLELHNKNSLYYIEVSDWFEGVKDYSSPEGHKWGEKGHLIIGNNLSQIIRKQVLDK